MIIKKNIYTVEYTFVYLWVNNDNKNKNGIVQRWLSIIKDDLGEHIPDQGQQHENTKCLQGIHPSNGDGDGAECICWLVDWWIALWHVYCIVWSSQPVFWPSRVLRYSERRVGGQGQILCYRSSNCLSVCLSVCPSIS